MRRRLEQGCADAQARRGFITETRRGGLLG